MYAIRLKGTNYYVKRCVGYELLNKGSGSTWTNKPNVNQIDAGGPWLDNIAELLGYDLEDYDALDNLCEIPGEELFEVIEIQFQEKG